MTFHGKVITAPRRLKRVMDRHDPRIYPGQYVTCVYNPDRALCHRRDSADGPCLPDCQPLACRNVALTSANIAELTRHQAHLEQACTPLGLSHRTCVTGSRSSTPRSTPSSPATASRSPGKHETGPASR